MPCILFIAPCSLSLVPYSLFLILCSLFLIHCLQKIAYYRQPFPSLVIDGPASQEGFRVRMLRMIKNFPYRILFHYFSLVHRNGPVSNFADYSKIMSDEYHTYILFLL